MIMNTIIFVDIIKRKNFYFEERRATKHTSQSEDPPTHRNKILSGKFVLLSKNQKTNKLAKLLISFFDKTKKQKKGLFSGFPQTCRRNSRDKDAKHKTAISQTSTKRLTLWSHFFSTDSALSVTCTRYHISFLEDGF